MSNSSEPLDVRPGKPPAKAAEPPPLPKRKKAVTKAAAKEAPSSETLAKAPPTTKKPKQPLSSSADEIPVAEPDEPTSNSADNDGKENQVSQGAGDDSSDSEPRESVAPRPPLVSRKALHNSTAFIGSLVVHLVGLILLGLIVMPEAIRQQIAPLESFQLEEEEDRLDTQILDENIAPSLHQAVAVTPNAVGFDGSEGLVLASVPPPKIEVQVDKGEEVDVSVEIDSPAFNTPESKVLIHDVPFGTLGEPRAIVDDYADAMDRITRELLMLLENSPVLVVWCFDQSVSMKDDQEEIRNRIGRVYTELGLSGKTNGGELTTAIASYGAGFNVHTRNPTANVEAIKRAIEAVPVDPSGKEVMCQAVIKSISAHRRAAKGRQMVLIVVTDETGEREDNLAYLEAAVAEAKAEECLCYFLGREAVFGYPYAFMRWEHPGTGRIHWLRVDRGPETAFVELLQTNGFRRRHDAFPSGFGPYEQTRLARETGGVYFMLPSLETTVVRGEKRRYQLEQMKSYKPDLRSRAVIDQDNADSLLIVRMNQVINTLNPYNPQVQPHIEMRIHFSPDPATFAKQVQQEKVKAAQYVMYLDRAGKSLRVGRNDRRPRP